MPDKPPILILAAGTSQRMGQVKQLLNLKNKRMISHAVDEAINSKISSVYVVTGYQKDLVEAELKDKVVHFIFNDNWQEGMGASIRRGILHLKSQEFTGVIISVCDQPYITKEIFRKLTDKINTTQKGIVYCDYENGYGPPVYYSKKYFNELTLIKGDHGAKSLIIKHKSDTDSISFPQGSFDLDTPDDYKSFLNRIN